METNIVQWARRGLWVTGVGYAVYASYMSRAQFLIWHADMEGAAHLIPPYRSMGYFLRYSFVHFWLQYVISFLIAALFFSCAKKINKWRGTLLFEKEEPYFLAFGLFISSHPGWIFYLMLVFAGYFLASLIGALAYGSRTRVSFYYFWLPCAGVTVILNAYLHKYAWYANLLI